MRSVGDARKSLEPDVTLKSEPLALDPTLDPMALRDAFQRFGRIHIPAFLTPASASSVHAVLADETEWMCSTRGAGKVIDLPIEHLEAFTPDQFATFTALAHADAAEAFHYIYDTVRISDGVRMMQPVHPVLTDVIAFMNSAPFLDFVRALTGDPRPSFVDGQATRFRPGHYLNNHDDRMDSRLYAYVLNLTPRWRTDWGGVLNFIDEDDHVAEGYRPSWNALNLFRVPQSHAVGYVAPFAQAPRLSITGWVRGG